MRILNYSFETSLSMDTEVSDHDFVLRCQPMTTHTQTVLDAQTVITPGCALASQTDGFGNLLQIGRIETPHDTFSFVSSGLVIVDAADTRAEAAHPMYARASRFTQISPELAAFSADVLRVKANADAISKAVLLSRALFEHMEYAPGTTTVTTDAAAAFCQGRGVCQDYAHILIALLRHEGVCARYVNGLMIGEGATHAWVEVHDGTCWRGLDPTNDREVDDSYIAISHGRDFADCPIESGVFRGGGRQKQVVSIVVGDQQ
jgi:transglutaminase-like putative cysteine protease